MTCQYGKGMQFGHGAGMVKACIQGPGAAVDIGALDDKGTLRPQPPVPLPHVVEPACQGVVLVVVVQGVLRLGVGILFLDQKHGLFRLAKIANPENAKPDWRALGGANGMTATFRRIFHDPVSKSFGMSRAMSTSGIGAFTGHRRAASWREGNAWSGCWSEGYMEWLR